MHIDKIRELWGEKFDNFKEKINNEGYMIIVDNDDSRNFNDFLIEIGGIENFKFNERYTLYTNNNKTYIRPKLSRDIEVLNVK